MTDTFDICSTGLNKCKYMYIPLSLEMHSFEISVVLVYPDLMTVTNSRQTPTLTGIESAIVAFSTRISLLTIYLINNTKYELSIFGYII